MLHFYNNGDNVYKVLRNIYLDIQFIKYLFNMFYIPDCLKDILKLIS